LNLLELDLFLLHLSECFLHTRDEVRVVLEMLAHDLEVPRVRLVSNLTNPLNELLKDLQIVGSDAERSLIAHHILH